MLVKAVAMLEKYDMHSILATNARHVLCNLTWRTDYLIDKRLSCSDGTRGLGQHTAGSIL
jgi:hypothetical protein